MAGLVLTVAFDAACTQAMHAGHKDVRGMGGWLIGLAFCTASDHPALVAVEIYNPHRLVVAREDPSWADPRPAVSC
jgi:hypothetical protein